MLPVDTKKVDLVSVFYHDERLSRRQHNLSLCALSRVKCGRCRWQKNLSGVVARRGGANKCANGIQLSVFNIEQFWDGRAATRKNSKQLDRVKSLLKSWLLNTG